jgi:hypothetical protein
VCGSSQDWNCCLSINERVGPSSKQTDLFPHNEKPLGCVRQDCRAGSLCWGIRWLVLVRIIFSFHQASTKICEQSGHLFDYSEFQRLICPFRTQSFRDVYHEKIYGSRMPKELRYLHGLNVVRLNPPKEISWLRELNVYPSFCIFKWR